LPGAKGERARNGNNGRDGNAGLPGSPGTAGEKGDAGIPGSPGVGTPGEAGRPGLPGQVGQKGETGRAGNAGTAGPPGANGAVGAEGRAGQQGMKGDRGLAGSPGNSGEVGSAGAAGAAGNSGTAGLRGNPGPPGSNGNPGNNGIPGEKGDLGRAGNDGRDGNPGTAGLPGRQGDRGADGRATTGASGTKGDVGIKGSNGMRGDTGSRGIPGIKGVSGPPGIAGTGVKGAKGGKGERGRAGAPGEAAQSIQLNPYIVAFHSQKNVAPKCFDGMTELWTGYSFMFVDADSKSKWSQDLGKSGSCIPEFYPGFYSQCSIDNCYSAAEAHKTTWLATAPEYLTDDHADRLPRGKLKLASSRRDELLSYISRCVVCDTIFKMVVVHSMTNQIPDCPDGFVTAASPNRFIPSAVQSNEWVGYSFWEVSLDNYAIGVITDQPASCLLYYSPTAVAECDVEGCKLKSSDQKSSWIMDTTKDLAEETENRRVFSAARDYVSRCRVCHRPEATKIVYKDLS